jgi:aspartate-semialdehyde dehydrogenase
MSRREGLRIGIVNPTTLVGREIKSILQERGVPYAHIELIDTGGQAAGTLTQLADEAAVVSPASEDSFEGLELVFFCGPAKANAPWITRHRDFGFVAIDLSHPFSPAADGVPIVAGVNLQDLTDSTRVIVSPHPIAIPVTLVLHQITTRAPIKLAAVSVIQPASELDQPAIDELLEQTIKVLNVKSIPTKVFERQLAFNLYPPPQGLEHERYAANQVRKILGGDAPLTIALIQGGLFHSHSFSMFLQTGGGLSERELLAALRENDAILVGEPDERFGTIDAGGKDQVLIGRVAKDETLADAFWIWAVVDNLRRSSALNGVLAAEALMARILA